MLQSEQVLFPDSYSIWEKSFNVSNPFEKA